MPKPVNSNLFQLVNLDLTRDCYVTNFYNNGHEIDGETAAERAIQRALRAAITGVAFYRKQKFTLGSNEFGYLSAIHAQIGEFLKNNDLEIYLSRSNIPQRLFFRTISGTITIDCDPLPDPHCMITDVTD